MFQSDLAHKTYLRIFLIPGTDLGAFAKPVYEVACIGSDLEDAGMAGWRSEMQYLMQPNPLNMFSICSEGLHLKHTILKFGGIISILGLNI